MPESAKKKALRERNKANLQGRKFRPVKLGTGASASAPRGRKKGRPSLGAAAEAVPAALLASFPPPAPAQTSGVDDSRLPCSCCGCAFGGGGTTFTARGEQPCHWDVCVKCWQCVIDAIDTRQTGTRRGVRVYAAR
jgi:hypothetical protein